MIEDSWYSPADLPPGRLRVRVRWAAWVVEAACDIDKRGQRHWHELVGRETRPLHAKIQAWQPVSPAWIWPNGRQPEPLPIRVEPAMATVGGLDFDAVQAAAEMEDWREAARARPDHIDDDPSLPWWRDVTRIEYQPMGAVSLGMGEARIMRHLIVERGLPNDLRRQKSNAATLADLKLTWADIYGAQSRGDDWVPPLVPLEQDWRDFETVMGWLSEVAPGKREMTVLRGRMLAPPATWRQIGDEIKRSPARAQQIYKSAIADLVEAANRPRRRASARIAEVQERNRAARRRA